MEEEALREKEVRLADSTETPISPDEFERLLLAEPDDSLLWTKYIAFYVEVIFARQIDYSLYPKLCYTFLQNPLLIVI